MNNATRQFTDTKGRTWTLAITVAAVKRVKGLCSIDLYALINDSMKPLAALLKDVVKLVDVLFVLARDSSGKPPESDESFAEAIAGDTLEKAAETFMDALIDFFPRASVRQSLKLVKEKSRQVADAAQQQAMTALEAADPEAIATMLAKKAVPEAFFVRS